MVKFSRRSQFPVWSDSEGTIRIARKNFKSERSSIAIFVTIVVNHFVAKNQMI